MSRSSRSRERMIGLRQRPVTATVTKPIWMMPEAHVGQRSASVESRGSTASLTSVLHHDSYFSVSDQEDEYQCGHSPSRHLFSRENKENAPFRDQNEEHNSTYVIQEKHCPVKKKVSRKFVESPQSDSTDTVSLEQKLSPWEQWLIQKVRNNRERKQEERQKRQEERRKREEEERNKQKQLAKGADILKEWIEKKKFEENLKKTVEKQREKTEKMIKEERKRMDDVKAERKYQEWLEKKKEEDKERKRQEKLKQAEEERQKEMQRAKAQAVFEKWCKQAHHRPKPLSSYGYHSGKLKGYHNISTYPVPTFYNALPWQPNHVPRPSSEKKSEKPYKKYA